MAIFKSNIDREGLLRLFTLVLVYIMYMPFFIMLYISANIRCNRDYVDMSEDKRRGDEVEDGGPGLVYMPFVIMEELLEKLRLLDYDREFQQKLKMKPISR